MTEGKRKTIKAKAAFPKHEGSMAEVVNQAMMKGMTWDALLAAVEAEAAKRGVNTFTNLAQLKQHAKFRAKSSKWNVTMDDETIKMTPADE